MFRNLSVWFVLVAVSGLAHAGELVAEVVDYGIYQLSLKTVPSKGTVSGAVGITNRETLLERTDRIPANRGVSFGLHYRVTGAEGGRVSIIHKIVFPGPGLTNPDSGTTRTEQSRRLEGPEGGAGYIGYTFDQDWERLPGEWRLEIWSIDGRRLLTVPFVVAQP